MKESFLNFVLTDQGFKQKQAAGLLGWTQQRVSYLCSDKAEGFPFHELPHLREKLGISIKTMLKLIERHLFNDK
tara:strand:+ start:78 stop:299 length:222 start_codon:yes stop_codon:yes gene_type:complete